MPQGRYLDAPRRNPAVIATVVLGHIAVFGALLLAAPDYVRAPFMPGPLIVHEYPDPKEPPPQPPVQPHTRAHPEQAAPQHERIDTVPPSIPTQDATRTELPPSYPPLDPVGAKEPVAPPIPVPVTIGAHPDGRYAGLFQPAYPPRLMREGVEGKVVVRVLVGADGRVKDVQPLSTSDPLFFEATRRQALGHWRFVPATRDGVPIETWQTLTVRFEIRGQTE